MKSSALMLIVLLLRFRNGQGIYLESPVSGDKVCVGTETGLAKLGSSSYHYKKMYRQFADCTYVFGNLEITHLKAGQDASFLSNIRVVTGYVLLFGNEMDIPLTSLVFVRGDMTYESYTIVIAMSPNVYLPALTEIGGSVKLFMPNCFLDSIHWQYISRGKVVRALGLEQPADKCNQCSDACAAKGHCWGPEQDMCQSVPLVQCDVACQNSTCYKEDMLGCCHPQCVGGCTDGWINSACHYCRHFYYKGSCIEDCPDGTYYIGGDCIDLN